MFFGPIGVGGPKLRVVGGNGWQKLHSQLTRLHVRNLPWARNGQYHEGAMVKYRVCNFSAR